MSIKICWIRHGILPLRLNSKRWDTRAFPGAVFQGTYSYDQRTAGKGLGKGNGSTSVLPLVLLSHTSDTVQTLAHLEYALPQALGEAESLTGLVSLRGDLTLIGGWTTVLDAPLDGPFEVGFAGLTECYTVVVAGGHILTNHGRGIWVESWAEPKVPTALFTDFIPSPSSSSLCPGRQQARAGSQARFTGASVSVSEERFELPGLTGSVLIKREAQCPSPGWTWCWSPGPPTGLAGRHWKHSYL